MTTASPLLQKEQTYIVNKFAEGQGNPTVFNPNKFTAAFSFRLLQTEHTALQLQLGIPVLGFDLTTRLFDKTYITANLGIATGELILQRKLIDHKSLGLAAGLYYAGKRRYVMLNEGESFLSLVVPQETFYNHHIGLRSVLNIQSSDRSYIHLFITPSYVANLQVFALNAGMAIHFTY
jgi:hypothetical protein